MLRLSKAPRGATPARGAAASDAAQLRATGSCGRNRCNKRASPYPPSVGSAQCAHKRAIVANVVIRIVTLGSEYQQRRIGAVLPLPAPYHRRNVDPHAWFIQHHFEPCRAVVDRDAALAVGANQELMAALVGMLSPDRPGWNAGDDKISLRLKRKFVFEFADRQVTARVFNRRKAIKHHSAHPDSGG